MSNSPHILSPWITPKIFPDFDNPLPQVKAFFDHYERWITRATLLSVNFCTGNGDHILNYAGKNHWDDSFDWARYNCYNGGDKQRYEHNALWVAKVREGGETTGNPYCAGSSFILSDQVMTYRKLGGIYSAFREEASRRRINFKLLEYLEPGPEMCSCVWKTIRHPEGSPGNADAGGTIVQGLIDVCTTLNADSFVYAAFPKGIPAGTNTGDFVAAQADAFTHDLGVDGVFLGNQFGLIGFWDPKNAPDPTPQRRAGVKRFFHNLREAMGSRLVYWMDTYWPADVEIQRWAMSPENYAQLDAVMVSNFAVIAHRDQIGPNIDSKLKIASQFGGRPAVLFSLDFVDCWYAYRTYLDLHPMFEFQHQMYRQYGQRCQGTSFFANDTFGQFVFEKPLKQTFDVVASVHGWT